MRYIIKIYFFNVFKRNRGIAERRTSDAIRMAEEAHPLSIIANLNNAMG